MKLYFAVALMVLLAAVAVSARPGGQGVSRDFFYRSSACLCIIIIIITIIIINA